MKGKAAAGFSLALVVALTVGCGGGESGQKLPTVTLWSSFPHRGPQKRQALLLERAVRGAVSNLSGRFKNYNLRYVALDSSSADVNGWDPGVAAANARRAALDPSTFGYIGELDSGATAVALPILNQAGVLVVSPSATAVGLTHRGVGAGPGAPFQYYPTGTRNFVRLVPRDSLQGSIIPALAKSHGCKSIALIDDGSIYGAGLADIVNYESKGRGLTVASQNTLDPRSSSYRSDLDKVKAGCILYSGEPSSSAVRVATDVARRNPRAWLIAPDALAGPSFVDPLHGGISAGLAKRTLVIGTVGPEKSYPPFGQWLWRNLTVRGENMVGIGTISAYAGVELAVACQQAAGLVRGRPHRAGILGCALGHNHYSRALGGYRVFARGDSSVNAYSRLVIKSGRLHRAEALHPPAPLTPAQKQASQSAG